MTILTLALWYIGGIGAFYIALVLWWGSSDSKYPWGFRFISLMFFTLSLYAWGHVWAH